MSPGRIKFKRPHLGWQYHLFNVRPYNRHSLILTVAGICYMLTGSTYILSELTSTRKQALAVALRWFSIETWGTIFILVGLMAVVSSRWPRIFKSWGYAILTGLSAGWSATYAAGVIFEHAPVGNMSAVLQWGLLAFLWWAIPGLVSPDKTVVVVVNADGEARDS
jgi:hypothetical protein